MRSFIGLEQRTNESSIFYPGKTDDTPIFEWEMLCLLATPFFVRPLSLSGSVTRGARAVCPIVHLALQASKRDRSKHKFTETRVAEDTRFSPERLAASRMFSSNHAYAESWGKRHPDTGRGGRPGPRKWNSPKFRPFKAIRCRENRDPEDFPSA